jgi:IS605 OrfB family transposase
MKRAVKRMARPLNVRKEQALRALTDAYVRQKDVYLVELAKAKNWRLWEADEREQRVFRIQHSLHSLLIHCEDQCLFDAIDTLKRWVEGVRVSERWKAAVYQASPDKKTRIQRYRILKSYGQMANVLLGKTRDPFLFHLLSYSLAQAPRVKLARSAALDNTLYTVYDHKGRQYIKIASLKKRERVVLPLLGYGRIAGNIRLVHAEDHWEIHTVFDVKAAETPAQKRVVGLDGGITEVFTDSDGVRHGANFGSIIQMMDDDLTEKGKRRNKIRARAEKSNKEKRCRVHKHNLGTKKQTQKRRRTQATIAREINQSIQEVMSTRPTLVVVEDLSGMRGRTKSKKLSRQVSLWMRAILKDRLLFKVQAGGSCLQAVLSAYTSQECSSCGYTHSDNRKGDHFRCLWCGMVDTADGNAAKVIVKRALDPAFLNLRTKWQMKAYLEKRNEAITGGIQKPTPAPEGERRPRRSAARKKEQPSSQGEVHALSMKPKTTATGKTPAACKA